MKQWNRAAIIRSVFLTVILTFGTRGQFPFRELLLEPDLVFIELLHGPLYDVLFSLQVPGVLDLALDLVG